MSDDLARLRVEQLREALDLLGLGTVGDLPSGRAQAGRALRQALAEPGFVRARLTDAPQGTAAAFERLVREGPLSVEALLGRGWWGRGLLPPPLDWLQRRALVVVDNAGLVRATGAATMGWSVQRLDVADGTDYDNVGGPPNDGEVDEQKKTTPVQPHLRLVQPTDPSGEPLSPVRIEQANSVVISGDAEELNRAIAIPQAGLRAIAPTVAVSKLTTEALRTALRAGGVALAGDQEVAVEPTAPALPGSTERAVTPWDIRAVFHRGVDEHRQIHLVYYPSSRGGAATQRTVDPWSFADNLLVGWCHLRKSERTFALDRVGEATLLSSPVQRQP